MFYVLGLAVYMLLVIVLNIFSEFKIYDYSIERLAKIKEFPRNIWNNTNNVRFLFRLIIAPLMGSVIFSWILFLSIISGSLVIQLVFKKNIHGSNK